MSVICSSLINSNQAIEVQNQELCDAFVAKLQDFRTHAITEIWAAKADFIHAKAAEAKRYTDSLRNTLQKKANDPLDKKLVADLFETQGAARKLFSKLLATKMGMLAIFDTAMFADNPNALRNFLADQHRLATIIPLLQNIESSRQPANTFQTWKDSSFVNATVSMAGTMLYKINNDILLAEQQLLQYCLNQTSVLTCGYREYYSTIAVLSSSSVKSGQSIKVTVGMGEFNAFSNPVIFINGKKIELNTEAMAITKFIANGKPGKHYIPVRVEMIHPDGTRAIKENRLEYLIQE